MALVLNGNVLVENNKASKSMVAQASEGATNPFRSPKIISSSTLPLIQSFMNRLGEEPQ